MLALNWLNTGSSKWTWKSSTSVEKFFIFVQRKVRNSSRQKHVGKGKKIKKNCYEQKNLINIFIFRTRYAKFTEIILTDWDQFSDGMNSSDGGVTGQKTNSNTHEMKQKKWANLPKQTGNLVNRAKCFCWISLCVCVYAWCHVWVKVCFAVISPAKHAF